MGTSNFWSMDKFPLYVIGDEEFYYEDEDGNEFYDEYLAQEFYDNISEIVEGYNSDLLFHKMSVKSGYYSGLQFYVETIHDNIEDWTNEDCRYEFDLCKSITIRKYQTEINKINRVLKKLAKENGFEQYYVYAMFSNGETHYRKVS